MKGCAGAVWRRPPWACGRGPSTGGWVGPRRAWLRPPGGAAILRRSVERAGEWNRPALGWRAEPQVGAEPREVVVRKLRGL